MRPVGGISLHVHAIRSVLIVEVVDIGRAEHDLKGVKDIAELDVQRFPRVAIDIQLNLGAIDTEGRVHGRLQLRRLKSAILYEACGLRHGLQPEIGPVLNLELKSADVSCWYRRWNNRVRERARHRHKISVESVRDRLYGLIRVLAVRPRF